MRIVLFYHSLISDWNHGNAHFLRGIVAELQARGHETIVYEPHDSWSRLHLLREAGPSAVIGFHRAFPQMRSEITDLDALSLDEALEGADLVLVHEWNRHSFVKRIGEHRARSGRYTLLFHDTHHRSVTDTRAMAAYDLESFDGVLAFGEVISEHYRALGWGRRAWTWHEAADTRTFIPMPAPETRRDLVWIGNWGDDERSEELRSYLIEPVADLHLSATAYGVRYPDHALQSLAAAGIDYGGWLPNASVPRAYAAHRMTMHVPRRPYLEVLHGIPTIRMFEALACGIPLVSLAWDDCEGLFTAGADYLEARTPRDMRRQLQLLAGDPSFGDALAAHGLATILQRHTCAHRVDELLTIVAGLRDTPREASLTL